MPELDWIDVSLPLATDMIHWPGDPAPSFERISDMDQGSDANVTMCRMSAHTGTHMDAPCHFVAAAAGMETFPLSLGIGRARLVTVPPETAAIGRAEVERFRPQRGERLLFRTRNSQRDWGCDDFRQDYVAFDSSGARALVDAGVALVGIDYLSIGLFASDGIETHRVLLGAGVWVVEGLNLRDVEPGAYEMVCMPLRILGSDGAPSRVALRPLPA